MWDISSSLCSGCSSGEHFCSQRGHISRDVVEGKRTDTLNFISVFYICIPLQTDIKPVREQTTSDLTTWESEKKEKVFCLPKNIEFCACSGFMATMIVTASAPNPRKCLCLNFSGPEHLTINKLFYSQNNSVREGVTKYMSECYKGWCWMDDGVPQLSSKFLVQFVFIHICWFPFQCLNHENELYLPVFYFLTLFYSSLTHSSHHYA